MRDVFYHNPACSTSRKLAALLKDAGRNPEVVEYLKTGWTPAQLQDLLQNLQLTARALLRTRGGLAEELGLLEGATEADILTAMVAHPVLVERPILVTSKGARLCRPVEKAYEIL